MEVSDVLLSVHTVFMLSLLLFVFLRERLERRDLELTLRGVVTGESNTIHAVAKRTGIPVIKTGRLLRKLSDARFLTAHSSSKGIFYMRTGGF